MRKLLIVNGWSDLNKGDSGILFGMINSFMKNRPSIEISLLSEFSRDDLRFISGYRYLLDFYPFLKIYGALLPHIPILHNDKKKELVLTKPRKIALRALYLIRSLIVLGFPSLGKIFLTKEEKKSLEAIKTADLIVSKGGHIFYSSGDNLKSLLGLYHHSYPLLLAVRFGKPFAFYAQSMGPFRGRLSKRFIRWPCSKASLITVREEVSKNILISLGVQEKKIKIVPDAAFALVPLTNTASRILDAIGIKENEKFVGITVRQWFFGKDSKSTNHYQNYLKVMAEFIDYIVERKNMKVVLMPQVLGPTKEENDLIASEEVYSLVRQRSKVFLLSKDLSPPSLMSIYGKAHAFVGTRFHSVIFALLMGVPAIAISYFGPKSVGIMKMMGLDDFVLNIEEISLEMMIKKFDILLRDRERIAADIRKRVENLRKEVEKTAALILQAATEG